MTRTEYRTAHTRARFKAKPGSMYAEGPLSFIVRGDGALVVSWVWEYLYPAGDIAARLVDAGNRYSPAARRDNIDNARARAHVPLPRD